MAAVVHHGGAGTTHTGLWAGVPTVVVPFFTDQPFWDQQVGGLGVGPRPIPRPQLSVVRLAAAIGRAVATRPCAPGQQPWASASGVRMELRGRWRLPGQPVTPIGPRAARKWHVSGTLSARCGTLTASDRSAGARGGPDGHRGSLDIHWRQMLR
jgi:hypothetical protein